VNFNIRKSDFVQMLNKTIASEAAHFQSRAQPPAKHEVVELPDDSGFCFLSLHERTISLNHVEFI